MKAKIALIFALAAALTSCTAAEVTDSTSSTSKAQVEAQASFVDTVSSEAEPDSSEWSEAQVEEEPCFDISHYQPSTDWHTLVEAFPNISFEAEIADTAFVEVNAGVPFFTLEEKADTVSFELYSELDELGRCGIAYANIGTDLFPTEERGNIGSVKPSGWQTSKYDKSVISDMYLYNRCHLIAFMLAGENANKQNLITGTRYLNIDGMLTFEDLTHDYLVENPDNHVLYRVTPMFRDDDLLAQGVLMEGWSVEDNGAGVQFCVFCYNIQPSIHIDYATGDNYWYGDVPEELEEPDNLVDSPILDTFILNTASKKIHLPSCSAVNDMKPQNMEQTSKPVEVLEDEGYTPCGLCKPQTKESVVIWKD